MQEDLPCDEKTFKFLKSVGFVSHGRVWREIQTNNYLTTQQALARVPEVAQKHLERIQEARDKAEAFCAKLAEPEVVAQATALSAELANATDDLNEALKDAEDLLVTQTAVPASVLLETKRHTWGTEKVFLAYDRGYLWVDTVGGYGGKNRCRLTSASRATRMLAAGRLTELATALSLTP